MVRHREQCSEKKRLFSSPVCVSSGYWCEPWRPIIGPVSKSNMDILVALTILITIATRIALTVANKTKKQNTRFSISI